MSQVVDIVTFLPKTLNRHGMMASELSLTLAEKESKVRNRMLITSWAAMAACGAGAYFGCKRSPAMAATYALGGLLAIIFAGNALLVTPALTEQVTK